MFVVTFASGHRAVVPGSSFAEAQDNALRFAARCHFGVRPHESNITGVHRVGGGLWLDPDKEWPVRPPKED